MRRPYKHTILALALVLALSAVSEAALGDRAGAGEQAAYTPGEENTDVKCGGGGACVFVNRDAGWVEYIPTDDPRNAGKPKPTPPEPGSFDGEDVPMLISISSYRDKLCPLTLMHIFTKAQHRDRIAVQVIQQNDNTVDPDCFDEYCRLMQEKYGNSHGGTSTCPYADNIHVLRVNSDEAKGPQWARAVGSEILQQSFAAAADHQDSSVGGHVMNEVIAASSPKGPWARLTATDSFCMQTDSHMDFVEDFDRLLTSMWADAKNEMAVLSTYVASLTELSISGEHDRGLNNLHEVPHLCMLTLYGAGGLPRNWGTKCARMLPEPKLTNALWGAGLSYSRCHAELKVPYDPHLPHIFDGEEFSRGLRFFTHGYDVYTPHRVYVLHNYHDSQKDPVHMAWGSARHHAGAVNDTVTGSVRPYDAVPAMLVYSTEKDGLTKNERTSKSQQRIKQLLQMADRTDQSEGAAREVQQTKYGLGDRRSLDQAIAFSGVDLKSRKMLANRCGNIDWVPYTPHPYGPAYVQTYDHETEVFSDYRDKGSLFYDPSVPAPPPKVAAAAAAAAEHRYHHEMRPVAVVTASSDKDESLPRLSLHGLEGLAGLLIGESGFSAADIDTKLQVTLRINQISDAAHVLSIQREIDAILFCLFAVFAGVTWVVGNRRFGWWGKTGKEFKNAESSRIAKIATDLTESNAKTV